MSSGTEAKKKADRYRLKRTDEPKAKYLGYSRNYYLQNAVDLRAEKSVYHEANGRRRYRHLEAKKQERQSLEEEAARRAKKEAGVIITQADVDDAVARFKAKGGIIEKIKTEHQKPTTGLVGIKPSRG